MRRLKDNHLGAAVSTVLCVRTQFRTDLLPREPRGLAPCGHRVLPRPSSGRPLRGGRRHSKTKRNPSHRAGPSNGQPRSSAAHPRSFVETHWSGRLRAGEPVWAAGGGGGGSSLPGRLDTRTPSRSQGRSSEQHRPWGTGCKNSTGRSEPTGVARLGCTQPERWLAAGEHIQKGAKKPCMHLEAAEKR